EAADRLNGLAAEVIAMSRIEAGKLHLDKRPCDVDVMIAGALAELAAGPGGHPRARQGTLGIDPGLPPARADSQLAPQVAQQVVKQFLENAMRYSPESAPITVTARLQGAKIVVGVADRGPGIPDNELSLIFDKFFRGRQHRFSTKGTGMGLAIAKGIAEAH